MREKKELEAERRRRFGTTRWSQSRRMCQIDTVAVCRLWSDWQCPSLCSDLGEVASNEHLVRLSYISEVRFTLKSVFQSLSDLILLLGY